MSEAVRFLHLADVHIGFRVTRFDEQVARKLREARFQALDNALQIARDREVDFILVAGDLFDDNTVSRVEVQRVYDMLKGKDMPVYVLPGNHDPYCAGSVWQRLPWSDTAGTSVHVLVDCEPVRVREGVTLYPCPVIHTTSRTDPTEWISAAKQGGGIRIGVAHGSVMDRDTLPEDDHPIPTNATDVALLDYLALGHWHQPRDFRGHDGANRMCYPGTIEQMAFGATSDVSIGWAAYAPGADREEFRGSAPGQALVVQIAAPRAAPVVERVPTGQYVWKDERIVVSDDEHFEGVFAETAKREQPERSLLRLSLAGVLSADSMLRLDGFREMLSRYMYCELDADGLMLVPDDERLEEAAGQEVVGEVLKRIRGRLAGDADDGERGVRREGYASPVSHCAGGQPMIIHSLQIRNWRKLQSVTLDQLSPTLNVVHAPNRVGKTSMVEAVRCALVDFEHDTTRIAPIVPWNTALVPEVIVGFGTGGDKYSLMKRFTRRREGGAELRKILGDDGPDQLVATDKEATARARELLGINRSDRGVAQLLWVEQGAVDLPRIDEELDRVLRPVLGSVVSGRDLDFRGILWSRMGQWFTSEENAVQSKHRKGSPLTVLSEAIRSHEEEVEGIAAEFRKVQELISEAERKELEMAEGEAAVASAQGEVEALKRRDTELGDKRRKADEFAGAVAACEDRLGKLEGALKTCCLNASRIDELKLELESAGQECKPLQEAVTAAREEVDLAAKARETADRKVEELRQREGGVEGMSRLLQIQSEVDRTRKALATAQQLERKIAETGTASAKLAAPNKGQLAEIKKTIDRLVELDAELKAAQLALEVKASDGGAIGLEIDGGSKESLNLGSDELVRRSVRQAGLGRD